MQQLRKLNKNPPPLPPTKKAQKRPLLHSDSTPDQEIKRSKLSSSERNEISSSLSSSQVRKRAADDDPDEEEEDQNDAKKLKNDLSGCESDSTLIKEQETAHDAVDSKIKETNVRTPRRLKFSEELSPKK